MNNAAKLLLIGGGAYLLYEQYKAGAFASIFPSAPSTPSTATGQGTSTQPTASGGASTQQSIPSVNLRQLIADDMLHQGYDPNNLYTWDEYNYFFHRVRGTYIMRDTTAVGSKSNDFKYTLDEFLAYAANAGLVGLAGLGTVIPTHLAPYSAIGRWAGKPVATDTSTWFERALKVRE